jgi:CubicO group peptidase (beta-lactamase class C family)
MKRIAAAILIAFSASAAYASEAPAAVSTAAPVAVPAFDLEQDVTRVMKAFDVPGIAIAVVKDGKVVAAQGFGVRKLGAPANVDGQTLFVMASYS